MTHVRVSGRAAKLGYRPGPIDDVDPLTLSCMPTSGPLHAMVWWSRLITDTPVWYHLGTMLPMLAYEMARLGWTIDQRRRMQPRLWTLLIGTSGIGKTTFIRRIRDFHTAVQCRFLDVADPKPPWIFCDGTQRGLFLALADHYVQDLDQTLAILTHDEFSVLLSDRRHQIDAQELCRWKDGGNFERHLAGDKKAKKEGEAVIDHLKNVSLSAVFATTASSFVRHSTGEHLEAGMYSRMCVHHRPIDPKTLRVEPDPCFDERELAIDELVNCLRHWSAPRETPLRKIVMIPDEVNRFLEETLLTDMRANWEEDGRLNASWRRSIENAKQVAGIFTFLDWCRDGSPVLTDPVMTIDDATRAIQYTKATIDDLSRVIGDVEVDPEMRLTNRVFEVIKRAGKAGCNRRDLIRAVGTSKFWLDRVLGTLEERESIVTSTYRPDGAGRPGKRYTAAPELLRAHLQLLHGGAELEPPDAVAADADVDATPAAESGDDG